MSKYSENRKAAARKEMTAAKICALPKRNNPISLEELRYHFQHRDEGTVAVITQAPAQGYAAHYSTFNDALYITLSPIDGLWHDANEALILEAQAARAKEAQSRAAAVAAALLKITSGKKPTALPEATNAPEASHATTSYLAVVKTCACGSAYLSSSAITAKRWCSESCQQAAKPKTRKWVLLRSAKRAEARRATQQQPCAHCTKQFTPQRLNAIYCSAECRIKANSARRAADA